MHKEVHDFIARMKKAFPAGFAEAKRVLEFGSLDINGTPRPFFYGVAEEYVGVDCREGNGVNFVSLAHTYRDRPDGYFDFVISTEMLEHDPYWIVSLQRMCELLKPGGVLLVTCAGPQRHAHDLTASPRAGYYENINVGQLLYGIHTRAWFKQVRAEDDDVAHDIRFFGWRKRCPPSHS